MSVFLLIAGCFVITPREVQEHDAGLEPKGDADADADVDTDTDTDTDADTDADADADTDTDTDADTDTTPTGDTAPVTVPWLLSTCPPTFPDDSISVFDPPTDIWIDGTDLVVHYSYGCGCANHVFGACFGTEFDGAAPTLDVQVVHDANGESCLALCNDDLRVDLLPVQQQYLDSYGAASGALDLEVTWISSSGAQVHTVPHAW